MGYMHKKWWLWLAAPLAAVVFSSCHSPQKVTPPQETAQSQLNRLFAHSSMVLTSRKKYGEVHIPFTLRDNIIYLHMVWAGRPLEAILDTGSSSVDWPQLLHLTSTSTGLLQDGKMVAGIVYQGECRVLPTIKAGDCEWRDIPTSADGEMKINEPLGSKKQLKTLAPSKALLGVPAFQAHVLTIDYRKKEIIIRGSSYDITRLPHHPQDLLLTPEWLNSYLPVLKGTLAGHSARFALDSGCGGLTISTIFAKRLPASSFGRPAIADINGVQVNTQVLKFISGKLADQSFQANGVSVLDPSDDYDALIGTQFLQHYRVTIDYYRGKILLEPYLGGGQ